MELQFSNLKIEEIENCNVYNNLPNLPEVAFQHILSFFSFEDLQELRPVSERFRCTCTVLLKKEILHLRKEVKKCLEKAYIREESPYNSLYRFKYISCVFWIAMEEALSQSYRTHDPKSGIVITHYRHCGKTLDVLRRIAWLKETDNPFLHLAEMILKRQNDSCNLLNIDHYLRAFFIWYKEKQDSAENPPSTPVRLHTANEHSLQICQRFPKLPDLGLPGVKYYWMAKDFLNTLLFTDDNVLKDLKKTLEGQTVRQGGTNNSVIMTVDELIDPLERVGLEEP